MQRAGQQPEESLADAQHSYLCPHPECHALWPSYRSFSFHLDRNPTHNSFLLERRISLRQCIARAVTREDYTDEQLEQMGLRPREEPRRELRSLTNRRQQQEEDSDDESYIPRLLPRDQLGDSSDEESYVPDPELEYDTEEEDNGSEEDEANYNPAAPHFANYAGTCTQCSFLSTQSPSCLMTFCCVLFR